MRTFMYVLAAWAAGGLSTAVAQSSAQRMPSGPSTTTQQTVQPPTRNRGNSASDGVQPERIPPASRGVGRSGRPDCSRLRGIEKAECERRDTTRDDLPAGVTTTQKEKPPHERQQE